MFKRNQIQKTLIAAGITLVSAVALAQQSETTTATVTVQNAFVFTEVDALSFGTITAQHVSGTDASFTLKPDGTNTTSTQSHMKVLAGGTPASYTVTGAASFTNLKGKLIGADTIDLVNSSAPAGDPIFVVSAFKVQKSGDTASTAITSVGLDSGTPAALQTDVNGEVTFAVGATITLPGINADITNFDKALVDGTYSGTYSLELSY